MAWRLKKATLGLVIPDKLPNYPKYMHTCIYYLYSISKGRLLEQISGTCTYMYCSDYRLPIATRNKCMRYRSSPTGASRVTILPLSCTLATPEKFFRRGSGSGEKENHRHNAMLIYIYMKKPPDLTTMRTGTGYM